MIGKRNEKNPCQNNVLLLDNELLNVGKDLKKRNNKDINENMKSENSKSNWCEFTGLS